MAALDVVRLKDGRTATILEDFGDAVMVEFSDVDFDSWDTPIISVDEVEEIIWKEEQMHEPSESDS